MQNSRKLSVGDTVHVFGCSGTLDRATSESMWDITLKDGKTRISAPLTEINTKVNGKFCATDAESAPEKQCANTDWSTILDDVQTETPYLENVPGFPEAFCIYNIFSAQECRRLVQKSEEIGYGKTDYNQGYRGNLRMQMYDSKLAETVLDRIGNLLPQTVDFEGDHWTLSKLNNRWRCAKYYTPASFGRHCDACYQESLFCRSMFTVNIYMNDDFEGGQTRMYSDRDNRTPIQPKPGMALIFRQPPEEDYLHDGATIESGIKYLFRTDVMYNAPDD